MASLTAIPAAATSLWVSSLFNPANRAAAIKEALSIAGLCVFSFRHQIPVSVAHLSWVAVVVSTTLCVFVGVSYICSKRSSLTGAKKLGGKRLRFEPVFFRCRTHHTRLFPKKHSFAYSVLEMGIPLSFHGSIGRLFSFDNGHNDNGASDRRWSLFSVDSRDYLGRGNDTLEEKMKTFLRENDMNLEDYPTVYLVTEPRFLGYQFNPVSFWYLKDKHSVLSFVVVEVNNTFDERHMYILRPSGTPIDPTIVPEADKPVLISSSFSKSFHVSPFNDRTGKYHVLTRDPLSSQEDSKDLVNTVITLYDDANNRKLIAAVRSTEPPIFMSDLSTSTMKSMLFVVKYGWSGLMTFPKIIWQASKLFGVKKLKVYFRPEVKGTSISRRATTLELQLEKYFRKYLQSRVQGYPHPLIVHYSAAGVESPLRKGTYQSISATEGAATTIPIQEVDITVFSPRFYVIWAVSQSMHHSLISEMLSKSEDKRSIEVSNLELTISLLDATEEGDAGSDRRYFGQGLAWRVIVGMRQWIFSRQNMATDITACVGKFGEAARLLPPRFDSPSVIDRRILLLPDFEPRSYRKCVAQALLTELIGISDGMLKGFDVIIRGTLVYLAWRGFVEAEILRPWGGVGGLVIWQMLKGTL